MADLKQTNGLVLLHAIRPAIAQVIRNKPTALRLLDKGYLQNSNSGKTHLESEGKTSDPYDYLAIPKNASGRRLAAMNFLHGVKTLKDYEHNVIKALFASYNDEV